MTRLIGNGIEETYVVGVEEFTLMMLQHQVELAIYQPNTMRELSDRYFVRWLLVLLL